MLVIGLTGSIGMGKSTAARLLRRQGLPVYDADKVVHRLLGPGGAAVARVAGAFPGTLTAEGAIDRRLLGGRVFGDRPALRRLERILHPMVRAAQRRFLIANRQRKAVVLDIPLLFEGGGARRCDAVLVVSAPAWLQRQRVLARPGMTPPRLAAILAQQLPDREKRHHASAVIPSGLGLAVTARALRQAIRSIILGVRPTHHPLWIDDARNRAGYRNHRLRPHGGSSHR